MYKFKYLEEPINFTQAGDLFNLLSRINEIKILREKNILNRFKFLQLSIKNNKDIYELNHITLDTPYYLGLNKKILSRELDLSLLPSQKLSYSFGLFISTLKVRLKYKYLKIIFFEFLKLIISFLISITDAILIILVSIFLLIKNKFKKAKYNNLNKIKEVYTIYFWKKKGKSSINYYYPDFKKREKSIAYASAFFQYKYFSLGLLNADKHKNIFTALDFIDLIKLIKSLIQLIIIYLFDLRIFINPTFGLIIKYFQSMRYINSRLISLLNYNSSSNLLNLNSLDFVYVWFENQTFNKGLLLGYSKYLNYINQKNLKIFIYYGFIFTKRSLNQYKPKYSELLLSNYLTNNFLHQNNESAEEMENLFYKNKFNLKFSVVRDSLKRYEKGYKNKKSIKKIIKRDFTIFSSHEFNELSIICYRLVNYIKDKSFYKDNQKVVIYIRLHPTLNLEKSFIKLKHFAKKNNFDLPHLEFIDNNKELLIHSLENTEYAIFGNSSTVNLALKHGVKVIAFRTNFLNETPIYNKYLNSKLIKIII